MSTPPRPTMPPPSPLQDAHAIWTGLQMDRANAAAQVHFQLNQVMPRIDRLGAFEAQAALQQIRDQASRIGYAQGDAAVQQVDTAIKAVQSGTYGTPQEQLLRSLNARTGVQTAELLSTKQGQWWDSVRQQAPTSAADWRSLTVSWDSAHPEAPASSLTPAHPSSLEDQLSLLDKTQIDASEVPDWRIFQPDPGLASMFSWPTAEPQTQQLEYRQGDQAAILARKQRGVPYVWGGTTSHGFDCSGLVQWVWAQQGVHIRRTTWEQVQQGRHVDFNGLQPGDAVYFDMNGGKSDANHVGLYIGNNQMVAAPKPHDVVKVYDLNAYWRGRLVDSRRFV